MLKFPLNNLYKFLIAITLATFTYIFIFLQITSIIFLPKFVIPKPMSDILLMIEIITSKIFVNGVLNVGTLKMHIMYGLGIPTNYTFNLGSYF